jgi:hypothetical protein
MARQMKKPGRSVLEKRRDKQTKRAKRDEAEQRRDRMSRATA